MRLDDVTIGRFRGLKDLELRGFGRVNLLVGLNSSGKTSVLEAIEALCQPLNPLHWIQLSSRRYLEREMGQVEALRWVFPQAAAKSTVTESEPVLLHAQGDYSVRKCQAAIQKIETESNAPNQRANLLKLESWLAERREAEAREELEAAQKSGNGLEKARRRLETTIAKSAQLQHELQESLDLKPGLIPGLRLNLQIEQIREPSKLTRQVEVTDEDRFVQTIDQSLPHVPVVMIAPFAHRTERLQVRQLSTAGLEGWRDQVVTLLRQIDPNLEGLEILDPEGTRSHLFVSHALAGKAPVGVLGDGIRRALTYALALPKARGGVLLIDELETSLHVSALSQVFGWLVNACEQYDVQLFATTHSLEAIDAVVAAARPHLDKVVAYRLGGSESGKRFSGQLLETLRFDLGQDVR